MGLAKIVSGLSASFSLLVECYSDPWVSDLSTILAVLFLSLLVKCYVDTRISRFWQTGPERDGLAARQSALAAALRSHSCGALPSARIQEL